MKRFPIIIEMLLTIVFLSIVPISLTVFKFNDSINYYFEEEIAKTALSNLSSSETIMNMYGSNLYREAINYSMLDFWEQLRFLKSYYQITGSPESINIVNSAYNSLKNVAYSNLRMHSIYLYQRNTDYFISSLNGVQRLDNALDNEWARFYSDILTGREQYYWKARKIPVNTETESAKALTTGEFKYTEVMSFFYLLKPLTGKTEGAIVINIYASEIQDILNSSGTDENNQVFVMDSKGDVVTHYDEALLHKNLSQDESLTEVLASQEAEGYAIRKNDNGERELLTYKKSDFNDWIFVSVNSMDALMARLSAIRLLGILALVVIMVLGFLLVMFINYRIYSPVNKLARAIRKSENVSNIRNEAVLVSSIFEKMSLKQTDMQADIENSKSSVKAIYLENLLKGVGEERGNPPVRFRFNQFIVIAAMLDRRNELILSMSPDIKQAYIKLFNEFWEGCPGTLANKEEAPEEGDCHYLHTDWGSAVLIVSIGSYDAINTSWFIKDWLLQFQKKIGTLSGITLSYGVGRCYEGHSGIRQSYGEALQALKRKLITGTGSIHFWRRSYEEPGHFFYPYHLEKHILNYLTTNDLESVKTALAAINDEIRRQHYIKYDNVVHIFNQLVGSTVKYLIDSNITMSDILQYNIYNKLSEKETLEDIEKLLVDFYARICNGPRTSGVTANYGDKILLYLHENYKREIDFEDLAGRLGISYSYLRKIVRERTGKSAQDYVNNLKIEEARNLLRNTQMSIRSISVEIGFSNVQSLNRFFKKYDGITPSEFRSLYQTGEAKRI